MSSWLLQIQNDRNEEKKCYTVVKKRTKEKMRVSHEVNKKTIERISNIL